VELLINQKCMVWFKGEKIYRKRKCLRESPPLPS
jgi:hypothetical protein